MSTIMKQNLYPGLVAGADLSALAYTAVKISAANTVAAAGVADAFGILQNSPASGAPAEVAVSGGGAFAKAGTGGWSAMDPLKVTTGGVLIVADTDGDLVIAEAVTAASEDDIAEVFVHKYPLFVAS